MDGKVFMFVLGISTYRFAKRTLVIMSQHERAIYTRAPKLHTSTRSRI